MVQARAAINQAVAVPAADEIKCEKPVAFVVRRVGATLTEAMVKDFAVHNTSYATAAR
jgi:long-chain acyl-CoA synthetase